MPSCTLFVTERWKLLCTSSSRVMLLLGAGIESSWDKFWRAWLWMVSRAHILFLTFSHACKLCNEIVRPCMLMWEIWRRRNDKVWNNIQYSDDSVVRRSDDFYQSWISVQRYDHMQIVEPYGSDDLKWKKPTMGLWKCNVDACKLLWTSKSNRSWHDHSWWSRELYSGKDNMGGALFKHPGRRILSLLTTLKYAADMELNNIVSLWLIKSDLPMLIYQRRVFN